jgi:hypothetical protein
VGYTARVARALAQSDRRAPRMHGYVRAVMETAKAKPLQAAAMMVGKAVQKAEQLLSSGR